MPGERIAGVLLAAGSATRFGADKLAAELHGETLLHRAASAMLGAGLDPVVVVVAAGADRVLPDSVTTVINADSRAGMATSVRAGLAALGGVPDVAAGILAPADQPWCGTPVYARLVDAYRRSGRPIIVAAFDGALRNPVLLSRTQWGLAREIDGDVGLSAVVRTRSPLAVECADAGSVADVDTPADLERGGAGPSVPRRVGFQLREEFHQGGGERRG